MTMLATDHPPIFTDGFGTRHLVRDEGTGGLLEHLVLAPELVDTPGFVVALGERVARLAGFRNTCYARVGHVEAGPASGVALVSEFTYAWRLSQVLEVAARERVPLEIGVVFALVRQLLPAVALLSQHARDVVHGALAPERLLVTPHGRLVVTEHVLGSAIDALQYGRERLWLDFRVGTPPSAGLPRMGPRTDVVQIGLVTLALLLGRPLNDKSFPAGLEGLVDEAQEQVSRSGPAALSRAVIEWLGRGLHLEARTAFQTPFEAQAALERVMADHRDTLAASASVDMLLARLALTLPSIVPPDTETPVDEEPAPAPVAEARAPATDSFATPAETAIEEPTAVAAPESEAPGFAPAPVVKEAPLAAPPADVPPVASRFRRLEVALAAVVVLALVEAVMLMALWNRAPAPGMAGDGELVVQSRPLAARVTVDGEERGVTPLTLRLPAGSHVLQVGVGGAEPRVIPLTIQPGVQTAQYVELLNVPTTGVLEVRSTPAGARVSVDGRDYGVTPLTIRDLPPGDREVVLERGSQRIVQRVSVEPGTTAQLVVPLP